jgi:tRNA 2-selenouridine synthase
MPIERIDTARFLQLAKTHPVLDVRSPGEYKHAHIPGANSFPLFSDEERKIVGTTYKQQSREQAIKIGLDLFGPKMRPFVEQAESITNQYQSKTLLVHCWRGGMRSGAIAWLLDLYGFKVYTLVGGYKNFRRFVLDTFKLPYNFRLIGGYTGSAKTELLETLRQHGEKVIDLEDIAKHKGSAFGNIGMPQQPGQEMFENMLALELIDKFSDPASIADVQIWLEDESQRIGQVNLPGALWQTMRNSPVFFLDIPFEERLAFIVAGYGGLEKERLVAAIERIREKLGGQNAKAAIQLLEEENTVESFRILLKYYDKFYLKGLHNRKDLNSLLHTIESKSITSENAGLLIQASKNLRQQV